MLAISLNVLLPVCIIPGLLIAVIWGPGVLIWFRNKEIKDLKSIDLAIFAAENGLAFERENSSIEAYLAHLYLRPMGKHGLRNIFTYQYNQARAHIFDYEFQPQAVYPTNWIIILIKFDSGSFPRFKINKHNPNLHSGPNLFMFMSQTKTSNLPDWGKGKISFYANRKDRSLLLKSLESRPNILSLIQSSGFQGLFFNKDCACLYLDGSLNESLIEHQQLENKARKIVTLFRGL